MPFLSRRDDAYSLLAESLDDLDVSALKGKIIVIDPGHGGRFSGAVGKKDLKEADVNLGVALKLARLLLEGGTYVVLTRYSKGDLLPLGGKDVDTPVLKEDLQVRVDISNNIEPDLFISIHHNADAKTNRDVNNTKVFYKMSDEGPSLDAGRDIHRHLVQNLRITSPDNKVLPGNYFVLRNNKAPAILGESSYISNPKIEKKLKTQDAQLLEAQSYFLGILDYFARQVPRVLNLSPRDTTISDVRPTIEGFVTDGEGGAGIDPQTIVMTLDGERIAHIFDPQRGTVSYRHPDRLSNSLHTISLSARNLRGNSSNLASASFYVSLPPARIDLSVRPEMAPPESGIPLMIRAFVTDKDRIPVVDGTEVVFASTLGRFELDTLTTENGIARAYLFSYRPGDVQITASYGNIENHIIASFDSIGELLAIRVKDDLDNRPLKGARITVDSDMPSRSERPTFSNAEGYLIIEDFESGMHRVFVEKDGYVPQSLNINIDDGKSSFLKVELSPVSGGVLLGRKIVIDPAFGGEETGPTGFWGTRASDINLGVARFVAEYLRKAGAIDHLTRDGDKSATPLQRVQVASRASADLFISISYEAYGKENPARSSRTTRTGHYPQSTEGKSLAEAIQEEVVSALKTQDGGTYQDASYVVQQTSCPAVLITPSFFSDPQEEYILMEPSRLKKTAYAIYKGVLRHYDTPDSSTISGKVLDNLSRPLGDALVVLDDYLPLQTEKDGAFSFGYIEGASHKIRASRGGYKGAQVEVNVERGEQRHIEISLQPKGAEPG